MDEETVNPQENVVEEQLEAVADAAQNAVEEAQVAQEEPQKVPLSALQKERKRRQELEQELQWERRRQQQLAPPPPVEEDNSKYESATREDLSRAQEEAIRVIEERIWIKNNPEKYEKVNEYLPQFLKQRPNLASAINSATNRYEEAYTLMDALTPKQQQALKPTVAKKEAPGAPTSVPKAAALNQAVDVMSMSDSEFVAWRNTQKKRR
jgi:hypothetical protein